MIILNAFKLQTGGFIVQSRFAVVWNARFHHQDLLDFVKHLINDLLKNFIFNEWLFLTSYDRV